jgi:hypothetical protein
MHKLPFAIRTYNGNRRALPPHTVFILNKGNNAGKPGKLPWTNSFAIMCDTGELADRIFSTCFILHTARAFEPMLNGSVIAFLRKYDLINVLRQYAHLYTEPERVADQRKLLLILQQVEHLEQQKIKMKKFSIAYARHLSK